VEELVCSDVDRRLSDFASATLVEDATDQLYLAAQQGERSVCLVLYLLERLDMHEKNTQRLCGLVEPLKRLVNLGNGSHSDLVGAQDAFEGLRELATDLTVAADSATTAAQADVRRAAGLDG
jgi:hypothetical protein